MQKWKYEVATVIDSVIIALPEGAVPLSAKIEDLPDGHYQMTVAYMTPYKEQEG